MAACEAWLTPAAVRPSAARAEAGDTGWFALACFCAAHVALGLAMRRHPGLATPAGALALSWCMANALSASRAYGVLSAAAYIVGSEVLWRMCGAGLPWESGKYALAGVFLIGLTRVRCPRVAAWALLYLLLLLPAALISYRALDAASFRDALSFNLSGALALVAGVCCCSNLRVSSQELWRALLAVLGPVAGIAAIAAFGTYSGASIQFSGEANFATSGGFGPNQVSASLGLGALVACLYLLLVRPGAGRAIVLFLAAAAFATQSALTFSRGGLYASGASFLAAAAVSAADRRARSRAVLFACFLVAAGALVFGPAANQLTGGKLAERFSQVQTTGRDNLVAADLALWAANPVYGVGVGVSKFWHPRQAAAHTEFSRLLAEHGLFGLAALTLLSFFLIQRIALVHGGDRALAVAMVVWASLYMLANGMRLAAPAFALSLAFLNIRPGRDVRTQARWPR